MLPCPTVLSLSGGANFGQQLNAALTSVRVTQYRHTPHHGTPYCLAWASSCFQPYIGLLGSIIVMLGLSSLLHLPHHVVDMGATLSVEQIHGSNGYLPISTQSIC